MPRFVLHTPCEAGGRCERARDFSADHSRRSPAWSWTITVWTNDEAMRAFRNGGDHVRSMRHLMDWCDEASYVHWPQDDATLPTQAMIFTRLRDEGHVSKVRYPSVAHAAGEKAGTQEAKMVGQFSPR